MVSSPGLPMFFYAPIPRVAPPGYSSSSNYCSDTRQAQTWSRCIFFCTNVDVQSVVMQMWQMHIGCPCNEIWFAVCPRSTHRNTRLQLPRKQVGFNLAKQMLHLSMVSSCLSVLRAYDLLRLFLFRFTVHPRKYLCVHSCWSAHIRASHPSCFVPGSTKGATSRPHPDAPDTTAAVSQSSPCLHDSIPQMHEVYIWHLKTRAANMKIFQGKCAYRISASQSV